MAKKKQQFNINGWLVVDKPLGISSARVVAAVKRLTKARKVGHGGTLDPLASGILPIALGEATKTMQFVFSDIKAYEFTVKFGEATETDDAEGAIVEISDHLPTSEAIKAILPEFIGAIEQTPPAYSAIKVDGKRAYALARKGEEVTLKPRTIEVHSLAIDEHTINTASFTVTCGKGTYVRSLARDIAKKLGTCGHVTSLRRTEVGDFKEKSAISLAKLEEMVDSAPPSATAVVECLADYLLPVSAVLDDIPVLQLDTETSTRLRNGQLVYAETPHDAEIVAAYTGDTLLAICSVQSDHMIKSIRVFNL